MSKELAISNQTPSVGGMLAAAIDGGITSENVGVLERLMDLYQRDKASTAEQEFARAFVLLQSKMPRIEAVKIVPGKEPGSIKYKFAPFEDIMKQVQPLLTECGFAVSFDTRTEPPRITVICTLIHKERHSRKNEFAVQIGSGPPGCSPTQADGAAKTYAKRNALCDALNIVTGVDVDGADDARLIGETIGEAEGDRLRNRVLAAGGNLESFLNWLDSASFADVPKSRLDEAHAQLDKKEKAKKKN